MRIFPAADDVLLGSIELWAVPPFSVFPHRAVVPLDKSEGPFKLERSTKNRKGPLSRPFLLTSTNPSGLFLFPGLLLAA